MPSVQCPTGEYRLHLVDERTGKWTPLSDWSPNTVLYEWGQIAANRLFSADSPLLINALYLEFENGTAAGSVSVPSFDRGDGLPYFEALSTSSVRDYLRVPLLLTPTVDVAPGSEAYFGAGQGNRVTVFGQSAGTTGVNGKTFSDSAGSVLCGLAVVAAPVLADSTQDVVFARTYYATDRQVAKQPSSQLGVTYRVTFG